MSQVLLIGGSTGTMLEALHVVGDVHGDVPDHEQHGLLNEVAVAHKK